MSTDRDKKQRTLDAMVASGMPWPEALALLDNAAAFQLIVSHKLDVQVEDGYATAGGPEGFCEESIEAHGGDVAAALRRAIARVVARERD